MGPQARDEGGVCRVRCWVDKSVVVLIVRAMVTASRENVPDLFY